ncbi:hypothetical protein FHW79_003171 [Azospirillum sp. OGB3]|uniref:hypothetical protein n=1 Tax=Azospirillum sp. OGB3 TaxID=2587012 RepID=UPI001605CAAB|nr:hypothetical protein [Azospirillum sp. OGB3]MBB3265542.1 hypothetical protein [Azospirillum sp. OGB3]
MMRAFRKRILIGVAGGLLAGGVAACSDPGAAPAAPDGAGSRTITWVAPNRPAQAGAALPAGGHQTDRMDAATLRWLAEEMARLGYYGGATDKPDAARVVAAVRAFRLDAGLPAQEPLVDEALQRRLGSAPAPGVARENRVVVVEELRCEDASGEWALVYEGERVADSSTPNGLVPVRIDRRLGFRHHPDAPDSVDATDWWCVPHRRICHSPVSFTDWGGNLQPGAVVGFHPSRILSGNGSWENQLAALIVQRCGRTGEVAR